MNNQFLFVFCLLELRNDFQYYEYHPEDILIKLNGVLINCSILIE